MERVSTKMERLTYESCIDGISEVGVNTGVDRSEVVIRLCDYENTGLTPEQIEEMKLTLKDLRRVIRFCLDKIGLQGDYFND